MNSRKTGRGKARTIKKEERVNVELANAAGLTVKQTMDRYGYCYELVVTVRRNQVIETVGNNMKLAYYEWSDDGTIDRT